MPTVALICIALPTALVFWAYVGYPACLWILARGRPGPSNEDPVEWPEVTINLPVYNEGRVIGATLDALLALDYPPDKRHILVISDCSSDDTDRIVASYADRGVSLVRLPERRGKTAAENEAAHHVRGDVVLNTDATTRIDHAGLKALIRAFNDPTVGVASGHDVSVSATGEPVSAEERSRGEAGYVGYEMWVRDLETRVGTIVGASGCFFAIRRRLFNHLVPEALSRDFASPLIAREHGFRSVSVPQAVCYVPRARSMKVEFRRKVRTMARGIETLYYKRHLLNPLRYGRFAWMLMSHKLARWLGFLTWPLVLVGLATAASTHPWAKLLLGGAVLALLTGVLVFARSDHWKPPRVLALVAFITMTLLASLLAWGKALSGERNPIWEPTRR